MPFGRHHTVEATKMRNKLKNEFEQWFHVANDHQPIDLLRDAAQKEAIRRSIWGNILSATAHQPKKQVWNLQWVRIAAIFLLVSTTTLLVYKQQKKPSIVKLLSYSTKNGEIKKIILADSSEIWLNGGSRIRVPEKFSKLREVYLDNGEVFFQVKKDPSRPFIVYSGQINTSVLGTSFNIRAYKNEPDVLVSVKTGKVQVAEKMGMGQVILLPADQISYSRIKNRFSRSIIHEEEINSWTVRRLYYRGSSLKNILNDLEKQYGVTFHTDSPELLSCVYTTSFDNLPLQRVLLKLKILGKLQFETKNNRINIKGKGCL